MSKVTLKEHDIDSLVETQYQKMWNSLPLKPSHTSQGDKVVFGKGFKRGMAWALKNVVVGEVVKERPKRYYA